MIIPLAVLAIVFLLIAVRQIGQVRLQIWQVMSGGALAVLLTGQISPADALRSINLDVMLFLFGVFVIGASLEESGYLSLLSNRLFRKARNIDELLLLILFGMGIASAFLMNDTLAIIGTPVVLLLAKKHHIHPQILLLTLAFAVTIGSVMTPIGNPQNLLIALAGGIDNPFVTFFHYLFIPTMVNLFLAFLLLKLFYKDHFHTARLNHSQEPLKDPGLARLSKVSLMLSACLILLKIVLAFLDSNIEVRLTYIALIAALPLLVFSRKRALLLRKTDWRTLVFFASMFVLMQSVWDAGLFQHLLSALHADISRTPVILVTSVLVSQLISNVPLVALYLPLLAHAGVTVKGLIALAAGSTVAGNLFILGAASNIIIIQTAERKSGETLTFLEFAKVGIPLTCVNILVYILFLVVL